MPKNEGDVIFGKRLSCQPVDTSRSVLLPTPNLKRLPFDSIQGTVRRLDHRVILRANRKSLGLFSVRLSKSPSMSRERSSSDTSHRRPLSTLSLCDLRPLHSLLKAFRPVKLAEESFRAPRLHLSTVGILWQVRILKVVSACCIVWSFWSLAPSFS